MTAKGISFLVALTVLNLAILAVQLSLGANATVAGMDQKALSFDKDFRGAVIAVVQELCEVNVRTRRIYC
jgi:hypothetical protein